MSRKSRTVSRSQLNFIIDIIMLVVMMLTAGIGLLIKYVLLPGFKRNLEYGRDVDLSFWGFDRHQWGTIHLIVSLVLVFLVLLHIILHWKQIKRLYCILVHDRQTRILGAIGLLVLCLVLAIGPLYVKPRITSMTAHNIGRMQHSINESQMSGDHASQSPEDAGARHGDHEHTSLSEEIPIYGYMTLEQVAEKYNVSASNLAIHLGVPVTETGRKLGRLRREYNFQMSAVRAYLQKNIKPGE
ncbi:DUF4405 domain-containing protein [candidate division KSB1 bacterium]|nr:DUF4405 domain-containing protein [candidate division KSB1 bacterium]RQW00319.1 MAG: DUF4405 domain-containing protein [candidate division KSB1 bacterium]